MSQDYWLYLPELVVSETYTGLIRVMHGGQSVIVWWLAAATARK